MLRPLSRSGSRSGASALSPASLRGRGRRGLPQPALKPSFEASGTVAESIMSPSPRWDGAPTSRIDSGSVAKFISEPGRSRQNQLLTPLTLGPTMLGLCSRRGTQAVNGGRL